MSGNCPVIQTCVLKFPTIFDLVPPFTDSFPFLEDSVKIIIADLEGFSKNDRKKNAIF
ncbi:hypothetical protein [Methanosarcina sp. 1.H.T.1A.1]|uniref:hypothetical protein n=1 Tax=Methanosarcina sp. 1.H.T.1A.1 TaxID=1483602 RepID=UPI0012E053E8|nr:hypothetical protein [Methanosarcina sp. 1.H.T.1A.1]